MGLTLTILGCGSSGGVPRIGQGWGACDPREPRNRRRRCSVLVSHRDGEACPQACAAACTHVLVDTSPDLRQQLLDVDLDHLDAILMTHAHADHSHGIDDVRPLVLKGRRRIGMYMDPATAARVRRTFAYIFATPPGSLYPPLLDERRAETGALLSLEGPGGILNAVPFQVHHGEIDALGYRFGAIAYTPDLNGIPEHSLTHLRGLDVWIVDALRYTPHPSHFSLEETLAWVDVLRPVRTVLTNLHTDMDFATLARSLPPGVEPAFDGMTISAA